jgi:hypothetical protein
MANAQTILIVSQGYVLTCYVIGYAKFQCQFFLYL